MASRWGPHRKPLQLRGFDLKVRFDGSIARLLDAGGWLRLTADGWLGLSWAHLNSGLGDLAALARPDLLYLDFLGFL